jgi:hypothetical protein
LRTALVIALGLALSILVLDAGAGIGRSRGISGPAGTAGTRVQRLSAITADFRASESATYYTATIVRGAQPAANQIKWTLKPPADDPTCKTFEPDALVRPGAGIDEWEVTAVWRHGDANGCAHRNGAQHSGTVTLEVANPQPRQRCTAKYVGTVDGTQDPGKCGVDCSYYDGELKRENALQEFLRAEIADAEKVVGEADKRYEATRAKVPSYKIVNDKEFNAALVDLGKAVGAVEEARAALARLRAKLAASRTREDQLLAEREKNCGKYRRLLSGSSQGGTPLCGAESLAAGQAVGKAAAFSAFGTAFRRAPLAAGQRSGRRAAAAFGRLAAQTAARGSSRVAAKLRSAANLTRRGNAAVARLKGIVRTNAAKLKTASRRRDATQQALDACLAAGFGS